MVNEHDISVINRLIEVTIDSADGYRKAADSADSHKFQQLFYSRAGEREDLVLQMQEFVRAQGGDPVDDGSLAAGAHRLFVDLRSAITGGDEAALVADVESGEDHIKAQYESALQDIELAPETRSLIQSGQRVVLAGHDQMRDLKHSMESVSRDM